MLLSAWPLWPVVAIVLKGASIAFIATVLLHGLVMLILSRRAVRPPAGPAPTPRVVLLVPCLNEARVLAASIDRLLCLPHEDLVVVIIDDGSDDETASIVASYAHPQVRLLRRVLPEARQGKGAALNAAVAWLVGSDIVGDRSPADVVIGVVDADGRLEDDVFTEVLPYFGDPMIGGVQTGVRINNRHVSRLARMQDMEFVTFTDVYQRARVSIGSVGLGGNGQFMRLSALQDLGERPWSDSLTEDLDLGLRLTARGWRTVYCPTTAVHQQGVVEFGRLVRQRTRWFHGHLQAWRLLPEIVRDVRGVARWDLVYHVTAPYLLLVASLLTASFVLGLLALGLAAASGAPFLGWWVVIAYLLAVVPALCFSQVYRARERADGLTRLGAMGVAHLYVLYGLMWYLAGWRAVGRIILARTGWAKTARTAETAVTTLPPVAGGTLETAPEPSAADLADVRGASAVSVPVGLGQGRVAGGPRAPFRSADRPGRARSSTSTPDPA